MIFLSVHASRWPWGLALIKWSVSSGLASCPETPWNCCGETPWRLNTSTYKWVFPANTFNSKTFYTKELANKSPFSNAGTLIIHQGLWKNHQNLSTRKTSFHFNKLHFFLDFLLIKVSIYEEKKFWRAFFLQDFESTPSMSESVEDQASRANCMTHSESI